ncbi:TonB-dependent receptor plug domain-containing protein [Kangiella shandongensis]|uniref:TonB-dependent receptor plug domain-containing protein n=1 Tax=Kangiella shandongensis TaxID=2763258 RepID=UPI001CBE9C97|nr:TonB-dependent receptor [Kangiella shandongensis]
MTKHNIIAQAVKVALLASASLAFTGTAYAADESSESEEETANNEPEKITVVGSRIKRTAIEGAQPVTVITNEDMAEQGHVTVFDALTNLTQNSSFQFEGPEFSSGFTPDVQTLNLRGIGVGNTLLLLNGRRISSYPAAYQSDTSVFNFGAIPAAAVKEIRILSTGASAIYGSDAVAGVVDIILKDDVDQTTVNLIVGTPTEADSNPLDTQLKVVTGKTFDKGNVTIAYQYTDRELITAGEFDDFDSDLDYPYGEGVLTRYVLGLNWWDNLNGREYYMDPGVGTCSGMANGTERSFRPVAGYFCGDDGAAQTSFRNAKESHSLFVHGDYQLSNDVSLFADVLYYQSESTNNSHYLFVSEDILDTSTVVDTGFGFNYFDWYLGQRLFTEEELGRSLDTEFEDDSLSFTVGANGFIGAHEWEVALNRSEYEYESKSPWWKAEEVINLFLGDYMGTSFFGTDWWSGTGVPFGLRGNLFEPLNDTTRPLVQNAIGIQTYGNETSSTSANFNITGDWFDNWAGTVSYAAVLEYEKQEFEFVPDARISQDPPLPNLPGSGWWKLTGYQGEGDRTRYALGGELLIPMSDTFEVNLAARVDNYDSQSSSIGTRTTPSLTFTWRPVDEFLLRGGYTGSFRAPDLNQVYTTTGFFTGTTDLVQCLQVHEFNGGTQDNFDPSTCSSSSSFVQRVGSQDLGGEPLDDETGYSAWLGFSVDITEELTLMTTYNRLNLEDRVQTESASNLLRDEFECYINSGEVDQARCDYIDARIDRETDPGTGISFVSRFNVSPINASKTEIDTLDASLRWGRNYDAGRLEFNIDYSHMLSNKYQANDDSEEIDLRDDEILGGWDPRSRVTTTLAWSAEDYRVALTAFRRGGVTAWRPSQRDPERDYRMRPYITYNLTANYNWTDSFSTGLRVRNLFDAEPPKDETFQFYDYPWYNHFVYAGAGIGRELYLEMNYTF